ncbi:MAG: MBL fold metallo-hydrolase [Lachnospiraceae bacterium]|nr:MBL fold metallo-hydrolase [Lachnospiraceae bacterium]
MEPEKRVEKIADNLNLYKISVPLKGNALRNLNCYVVKTKEGSFLVDTGFNTKDCKEALLEGLEELGISPEHTNLLVTHFHSDHIGLAECFDHPDSAIYIGRNEFEYYNNFVRHGNYWSLQDDVFEKDGFPIHELLETRKENPAYIHTPREDFPVVTLEDQEEFNLCGLTLKAIEVPGHTPGQMCYYLTKEKIMFLGDHILFDITPNIVSWPRVDNSLKKYMESLKKIQKFEIDLALPGHRNLRDKTVDMRIREILSHHEKRLKEIMGVIEAHPGLNSYEIAGKLTWSLHGATWENAPLQQKWFAFGETKAHLEYLIAEHKIFKQRNVYFRFV